MHKFQIWFKRWRACLPFVMIGIVMFFLTIAVGGSQLAGIPIALMFVVAGLPSMDVSPRIYLRYYVVLTLCAVLGVIATMNYVLCLVINFVVLFLIIYINGDDFLPKNYFMYGFLFVMPQMYRLHWKDVVSTLICCALCFSLMSVFVFVKHKIGKKPDSLHYVDDGCSLLAGNLRNIRELKDEEAFHKIVNNYCHQIYGDTTKQLGKMNEGQAWKFQVLSYLEQINHMAAENSILYRNGKLTDTSWYEELGGLFDKAAESKEKGRFQKLGQDILDFIDHSILEEGFHSSDWHTLLTRFAGELAKETQCYSRKVSLREGVAMKRFILKKRFNRQSGVFRFALKAAILVTLCYAVSYQLAFSKAFWLPMTVYSMLTVFHQDEQKSASARLLGTILGMVLFALVTEFIPGPPTVKMLVMLFVGFSLIFSFSDQKITMMIGTQMSVGSLFPLYMSVGQAMEVRFLVVLAAAVVVWIGGQLIFKTEKADALRSQLSNLLFYYQILVAELGRILDGKDTGVITEELLLRVEMRTNEVAALAGSSPNIEDAKRFREVVLPSCRAFQVEMMQVFIVCNPSALPEMAKEYFQSEILVMQELLNSFRENGHIHAAVAPDGNVHGHMAHLNQNLQNILKNLKPNS